LVDSLDCPAHLHTPDCAAVEAEVRDAVCEVTPKQQEICQALAQGMTVSLIARDMGHCWHTIERQVKRIRRHFRDRELDAWDA